MTTYQKFRKLNFSKEYYDLLSAVMPTDRRPSEWKVTVDGGFCPERGKNGKCITVNRTFNWGDEVWHVPAVYVCSTGLVVDFCIEINEERMKAYYAKCKAIEAQGIPLTEEEEDAVRLECPTDISFIASVKLNGEVIHVKQEYGHNWYSAEIACEEWECDSEAKWVLEHYGLDLSKSWVIRRASFIWEGRRSVDVQSLSLMLERRLVNIPGQHFLTPEVGEGIVFENPVTGQQYKLTVRDMETGAMENLFHDETMEHPQNYAAMVYTVYPELPREQFSVKACRQGDSSRPKDGMNRGHMAMVYGGAAVMYRADGQPEFYEDEGVKLTPQSSFAGLYFEPVKEPVEWRMVFSEKRMDDMEVKLI